MSRAISELLNFMFSSISRYIFKDIEFLVNSSERISFIVLVMVRFRDKLSVLYWKYTHFNGRFKIRIQFEFSEEIHWSNVKKEQLILKWLAGQMFQPEFCLPLMELEHIKLSQDSQILLIDQWQARRKCAGD